VVGRGQKVGHRPCEPLDGLTYRAANLDFQEAEMLTG
jgi:hypothetical protein